jgi:PAS domain S-box-containing protein
LKCAGFKKALVESEASYKRLFESVPCGIALSDWDGRIHEVNKKMCEILKLSKGRLILRRATSFYAQKGERQNLLRELKRSKKVEGREIVLVRGDKTVFPAIVYMVTVVINGNQLLMTIVGDMSRRRLLENLVVSVGEQERQRIGRDLHDALGGKLAGIAMIAKSVSQSLVERFPSHAAVANDLVRYINESITETRAIARGLCPIELGDVDLIGGLEELSRQTSSHFGINCQIRNGGKRLCVNRSGSHHLFRIAQEAVFNAIRHGKAKSIVIKLTGGKKQIRMTVQDDGIGFLDDRIQKNGMGMDTMKYRAGIIGGTLTIKEGRNHGVVVCCQAFLKRQPSRNGK